MLFSSSSLLGASFALCSVAASPASALSQGQNVLPFSISRDAYIHDAQARPLSYLRLGTCRSSRRSFLGTNADPPWVLCLQEDLHSCTRRSYRRNHKAAAAAVEVPSGRLPRWRGRFIKCSCIAAKGFFTHIRQRGERRH